MSPAGRQSLPKRWNGKATQRLLRCQTETESADVPADGTAVLKIVAAPSTPALTESAGRPPLFPLRPSGPALAALLRQAAQALPQRLLLKAR